MSKFEWMLSSIKKSDFLRFSKSEADQNHFDRKKIFWRTFGCGLVILLLFSTITVIKAGSFDFAKNLVGPTLSLSPVVTELGTADTLAQSVGLNAELSADVPQQFDPLTVVEQNDVVNLALREIGQNPQTAKPIQAAGLQRETLLIERHKEPKNASRDRAAAIPRRGDAYIYDYEDDLLIHAIIDLDSGEVDEIGQSQGVQLPLTQNEIDRALTLAYQDERFRQQIEAEFQAIAGRTLTGLSELEVRAFIFHASSLLGNIVSEAESCGINRCAHLLLYTTEDIAFEMLPVVNLSTGVVLAEARLAVETSSLDMSVSELSKSERTTVPMQLLEEENTGGEQ